MLQVLLLHRYIWFNADIDRVSARPFSDKLINYWDISWFWSSTRNGLTYEGELITRGIETRRHDSPKFIKDFQRELIYTLFAAYSPIEIIDRTLENALFCVTKTIDKVMMGEIDPTDLIISKQLRIDITKYRSIFPHVAAAIQLRPMVNHPVKVTLYNI